jgi:hypothetical protein
MTFALGLLAVLATWFSVTPSATGHSNAAADTLHVLFIGNSFTYFNNMPRMVEAMGMGSGRQPISSRMVATGGASLEDDWADSLVQQALHSRRWDWVVVNDQSTFSETYLVNGQFRVHGWAELEPNAAHFDSAARTMGARFAIIMHWPDQDAPARDADALAYAFTSVARRLHATLIPVEPVWLSVRHSDPAIELYDADKHHPSPAGSYLLASVVYSTLTNRPAGPGPDTVRGPAVEEAEGHVHPDSLVLLAALSPATVSTLQHAAWQEHEALAAHQGYPAASPPSPIALPALPSSAEPLTDAGLVGTWHGQLQFYPFPTTFTLEVRDQHGTLGGILHLVIGGPSARARDDSVAIQLRDNGTLFTMEDPSGPNNSSVKYKARYHDRTLTGIAEAVTADSALCVFGTWTLHHDQ